MMSNVVSRFDMRKEQDGTWTVFDIFTKLAAEIDGIPFLGMTIEEADDAIDLLNWLDAQNESKPR